MKLRDAVKLPELSGFKLIAGEGGLDKDVVSSEFVDFEFAADIHFTREEMFYGNSIGLTSLMFARHAPSLILDAVRQLDEMGVACLCYKPIFFKELPEEVLSYADSNGFPIFVITDDAFFEDVVLALKREAGLDMTEKEMDEAFENILSDRISDKELEKLRHMVLPASGEYIQAACFEADSGDGDQNDLFGRDMLVRCKKRLSLDGRFSSRVTLVRFGHGGLIIMARGSDSGGDMEVLLRDASIACGLPIDESVIGLSSICHRDDLQDAVRESYWSLQTAIIRNRKLMKYHEMGIYGIIAPDIRTGRLVGSAMRFMRPLLGNAGDEGAGDHIDHNDHDDRDNNDSSLLVTAKEYVLSDRDLNKTADKLFCHKNTIRYRIRKIHEMTAPELTDEEFDEILSLSVRVLLLDGTLRNV